MNIITLIQDAITALNHNAEVNIFEKSRDENEALEYIVPQIVIFPDWTSRVKDANLQLQENRVYNIVFKTQDENDNSDADSSKSYNDSTSVDRIEDMATLANSVFRWINNNIDSYSLNKPLEWSSPSPILRENNGTMSGVEIKLTANFLGDFICNYGL